MDLKNIVLGETEKQNIFNTMPLNKQMHASRKNTVKKASVLECSFTFTV